MDDETTFYQATTHSLWSSLIDRMDVLAEERLSALWPLSFDQLSCLEPELLRVRGPWGANGSLRTEVKEVEQDNLRVKVLWEVRFWWWPGYYKAYAGFYRARYGDSRVAVESFS